MKQNMLRQLTTSTLICRSHRRKGLRSLAAGSAPAGILQYMLNMLCPHVQVCMKASEA